MINKIYGIIGDGSLDVLPIILHMVNIQNNPQSDKEKFFVQKNKALYSSKEVGFYEDRKIIVLADANIEVSGRTNNPSASEENIFNKSSEALQIGHLYHQYGQDLLKYIDGAFSFVVWDKVHREMFGARDRLGIKNLFYSCINKNLLIFASELKAILSSKIVKKDLDQNAIYHFLFMKAFEQPSTPFKNIKSLLPGHYFIFKENTFHVEKYWDINFKKKTYIDEDEAIISIEKYLNNYLNIFINNIEPKSYGVLLSGGIDSSYLTALLANYIKEPVRTFTIRFGKEGIDYDEAKYARIVSNLFNTQHAEIEINENTIKDNLIDFVWKMNTPVANSGYKLNSLFQNEEANDLQYIFMGEGADTLFGLDERWGQFEQLEKYLHFFRILPEYLREAFYSIFEKEFNLIRRLINIKYIRGLHRFFYTKSGYFKWKGSSINENEVKRLFIDKKELFSIKKLYRNHFKNANVSNLSDKCVYTSLKTYTPNQQLTHYTSICAANNSEALFPFLDTSLLEYCLNLPYSLKAKSGIKKYLLYQLSKSIMPKEIIERPKMVFKMPFEHWLNGKLRPIVDNVFSQKQIEKKGIFNYIEMKKLYESYLNNELPWVDIWSFVILELWLKLFVDSVDVHKPDCTIEDLFEIN